MSVPLSLLALLSQGPAYGARIKAEFEARTGHAFPLNVGQVYTTLARLERDGLVVPDGGPDDEGRWNDDEAGVHLAFRKELTFSAFDPETARAMWLRTRGWDVLLSVTIGLAIPAAARPLGALPPRR